MLIWKIAHLVLNNNNSLAWKYKVLKYRTKCFNIVEQVKNSDMRTMDTASLPIFIIMYHYLRHKCSTDLVLEYCGGKASHVHHWSVIVVSLYYILSIIITDDGKWWLITKFAIDKQQEAPNGWGDIFIGIWNCHCFLSIQIERTAFQKQTWHNRLTKWNFCDNK